MIGSYFDFLFEKHRQGRNNVIYRVPGKKKLRCSLFTPGFLLGVILLLSLHVDTVMYLLVFRITDMLVC